MFNSTKRLALILGSVAFGIATVPSAVSAQQIIYGEPEDYPAERLNYPRTIPFPEERSDPIAYVAPIEGTVNVRLTNDAYGEVQYQALGHTERRTLAAGESVLLQDLPVPVTITAVREVDGGLLDIIPVNSESGTLEVVLDEERGLDETQGVLRIQPDGEVFVN